MCVLTCKKYLTEIYLYCVSSQERIFMGEKRMKEKKESFSDFLGNCNNYSCAKFSFLFLLSALSVCLFNQYYWTLQQRQILLSMNPWHELILFLLFISDCEGTTCSCRTARPNPQRLSCPITDWLCFSWMQKQLLWEVQE